MNILSLTRVTFLTMYYDYSRGCTWSSKYNKLMKSIFKTSETLRTPVPWTLGLLIFFPVFVLKFNFE